MWCLALSGKQLAKSMRPPLFWSRDSQSCAQAPALHGDRCWLASAGLRAHRMRLFRLKDDAAALLCMHTDTATCDTASTVAQQTHSAVQRVAGLAPMRLPDMPLQVLEKTTGVFLVQQAAAAWASGTGNAGQAARSAGAAPSAAGHEGATAAQAAAPLAASRRPPPAEQHAGRDGGRQRAGKGTPLPAAEGVAGPVLKTCSL